VQEIRKGERIAMSLGVRLKEILAIDHTAPAIEFEGQWHDWGALARSRDAIDTVLREAGLGKNSRVGILLRNHAAIVPAVLAVLGEARCLITLNPVLSGEKVSADVVSTQVPAIIGLATDLDAVAPALVQAGCLAIAVGPSPSDPLRVRQPRNASAEHRVAADDVAVEMLTSGTTGAPKRINMKRTGFEKSVFAAARFEKGRSGDDKPTLRSGVQLLMAPFAHIGGLLALMNAIVAGRSAALLPKFNVPGFRDAVRRHGIKVVSAPPAALKMILDAGVAKEEIGSLMAFRTGTAPLDPDLGDAFYEAYGIPVLQNYGATEFGGVAGWTLGDFETFRTSKRGAVGRLNPGVEGRVVDVETGEPVALGQAGVLELKAAQIGDGRNWLQTTDLAKIDADGFLFILGRTDNVIIRGGFKIQPDDIVRAAESHPGVREAVVAGMPDSRLGQVPVLAFLPKSDVAAPSPADLDAHLRGKLSPYQVPVAIHALEEFPRTPSFKVDQTALKKLIEARS
jgi:acyl-CoA synthetase (AMP-forming)/AMP-acid ligase II